MNKKIILISLILCLFSSLPHFAYATWEVSLQELRNSVQLNKDDNYLIRAAIEKVETLQSDIETVTAELFALDEAEKQKNPNLTTSYRQARAEIVRVISSINTVSANISASLKKITTYQKQMWEMLRELQMTQNSSEKAKQYLSEYMTLLYKMQLKIYDQDWDHIDDIRLFVNSDNFYETFVWNDLLSAMTVQLSELIEKSNQEELKKTNLLSKLWNLKTAAQESIESYRK